MRLATARDELVPLRDDRVRENPAYLTVVLLARVVTRLGTIDDVHAGIIENLFASDLAFLQDLYRRVNQEGHTRAGGHLPVLPARVRRRRRRGPPGGIVTYAPDRLHEEVAYVAYHFHWALDDDPRPRARGPAPLRRRDRQDERPGTAGEVTGMGLWSWLRGSWSGPSRPRRPRLRGWPRTGARAPRPIPGGARCRRCSGCSRDGAQPVARLGDFAGSLATWQSPRMLTGLEHGRGPSAPAGTVAGIVDAVGGAPGLTSLPASPVSSCRRPAPGRFAGGRRRGR